MGLLKKSVLVLILILVTLAVAAGPALASGEVTVSVDPDSVSVTKGKTFSVDLVIDAGSTEILGWQGVLYFDPELLSCTEVSAGDFFDSEGDTLSIKNANSIDNEAGKIAMANVLGSQDGSGVSGSGLLSEITFKALDTGDAVLTLGNFTIADSDIQAVEDVTLNGATVTVKAASSSGGGGGGGGGSSSYAVGLSGFLSVSSISTSNSGAADSAVTLNLKDSGASLAIAAGTTLQSSTGSRLSVLSAAALSDPPAPPAGYALISAYSFGPEGAKFSPALNLQLHYDPSALPADVVEKGLCAAWLEGNQWSIQTGTALDTQNHYLKIDLEHFSSYALLGKQEPLTAPAETTTITSEPPLETPVISTTPTTTAASNVAASTTAASTAASTSAAASAAPATASSGALNFSLKGLSNSSGKFITDYQSQKTLSKDPALDISLLIESGTLALTSDQQPLEYINLVSIDPGDTFLPDKTALIAVFECTPTGASFAPGFNLKIDYTPAGLPAGVAEDDLKIAFYDSYQNRWTAFDCQVDSLNHSVTATVDHFSTLALLALPSSAASTDKSWIIYLVIGLVAVAVVVVLVIWLTRRKKTGRPGGQSDPVNPAPPADSSNDLGRYLKDNLKR